MIMMRERSPSSKSKAGNCLSRQCPALCVLFILAAVYTQYQHNSHHPRTVAPLKVIISKQIPQVVTMLFSRLAVAYFGLHSLSPYFSVEAVSTASAPALVVLVDDDHDGEPRK
jgi:hypothetical protein